LLVVKGAHGADRPAEELIEPVRAVLEQIRTTVAIAPEFDPATATGRCASWPRTIRRRCCWRARWPRWRATRPTCASRSSRWATIPIDALERGQIDLLLTIDYRDQRDHPSQVLFEDDYVVVGDAANPAMEGEMSREKYFALGHVTARFGKSRTPAFDDWFVRRQKTQRRIEVVAPTFLSQTSLVLGTRRIATMHRRLATQMARFLPLSRESADIPPIREAIQWHITNNNDRALRWVVERLAAMAHEDRTEISNVVPLAEAQRDEIAVRTTITPICVVRRTDPLRGHDDLPKGSAQTGTSGQFNKTDSTRPMQCVFPKLALHHKGANSGEICMSILGVESVLFGVDDLAKNARFWTDFGLPVESITENEAVFRLASGSRVILLPR
jgi:hypothetical protein